MISRIILSAFFIFFLPIGLSGDPAFWKASLDSDFSAELHLSALSIPIDGTIEASLILHFPAHYNVNLDKIRASLLKYSRLGQSPFALISEGDETLPNGRKILYKLEPLLEGSFYLSLYDIVFNPKDPSHDSSKVIFSKIFNVEVYLPKMEKNYIGIPYPLLSLTQHYPIEISSDNRINLLENPKIEDHEEKRNIEIINAKAIPWVQLAAACLFFSLVVIARFLPKKKPAREKEIKKAFKAKKKALYALKHLAKERLPEKKAFDDFYVSLTATVRKYIEDYYHIQASTKTTTEFLSTMTTVSSIDNDTKEILKNFLKSADRVKFAEHQPSLKECREAHHMAKEVINRPDKNKRRI